MDAWSDAITAFSDYQRSAGHSAETVKLTGKHLRRFAAHSGIPPWEVEPRHLAAFVASRTWAPATRDSFRGRIRAFYRWAMLTGQVHLDPTRQLPGVKVPAQAPRPTPDDVLTTALAQIDDRTRLMVLLAANAGLRRAEIAAVHTRDVSGGQLRVKGKGGKVRMVPIHPAIAEALAGVDAGFVFPGNDNGHLSPDRVGRIISGALGPGWTAHTLRHRFATKGYGASHDLFGLQQVLGHASPNTTRRYTATSEAAALAIVMAS